MVALAATLLAACNEDAGVTNGDGGIEPNDGQVAASDATACLDDLPSPRSFGFEAGLRFGFGGGQPGYLTFVNDVAAADVDEDGADDLILSYVPLPDGDGFDPRERLLVVSAAGEVESAPGACLRGIVPGRFNGDRHVDVVVGGGDCVGTGARVHFGDGRGHFAPAAQAFPAPGRRLAADVNADGLDDLVLFGASVQVLLCDGEGRFHLASERRLAHAAQSAFPVDLNGDRRPDLVCSDGGGRVQVLLGAGDGTFALQPEQTLAVSALVAADFDGDGRIDVAGDAFAAGRGDGTFGARIATGLGALSPLFAADFDRDGLADLVAGTAGAPPRFLVATSRGGGCFGSAISFDASAGGWEEVGFALLGTADFNGDGRPDVYGITWYFEGAAVITRLNKAR